jgi:hypothetical protein
MKSTFLGQRVNFLGPASLVVGEQRIAGKVLMCGTLYVEVGAATSVATASSLPGFKPSDISGSFTASEAGALSTLKAAVAEIVWKNQGKETTLPISISKVAGEGATFVARTP